MTLEMIITASLALVFFGFTFLFIAMIDSAPAKKICLFLDDERIPSDVTWLKLPECDYFIARNQKMFEEFILKNGIPDFISFDNDLGEGQGEGIYCANWLINAVLDKKVKWNPDFKFTVHSKNPVAGRLITEKMNSFISHLQQ